MMISQLITDGNKDPRNFCRLSTRQAYYTYNTLFRLKHAVLIHDTMIPFSKQLSPVNLVTLLARRVKFFFGACLCCLCAL
jgi:hypothetical protein